LTGEIKNTGKYSTIQYRKTANVVTSTVQAAGTGISSYPTKINQKLWNNALQKQFFDLHLQLQFYYVPVL
jgi:hypothetical protein